MLLQSFFVLLAVAAAAALPSVQPISRRSAAFSFGNEKVRGLNIGGWLVLEPWITPSIFKSVDQSLGIVDEYTLTQKLGTGRALGFLKPHWDSFCTLSDFQRIAAAGFNTVRIPIGYWAFSLEDGEPYTQGAAPYLDLAIGWARTTGLKVLIDLHGAPGSQNGFDNSGHKVNAPGWQDGNTVQRTLDVLKTISTKYAQQQYQDVVMGIELLNEPLSSEMSLDKLKDFYRDGFNQVRQTSDMPVVIHDAFNRPSSWNGFLTPDDNGSQNTMVDHHEYQVFTNDLVALQPWQHRQLVCNNAASWGGTDKWEVIGEFTNAMTDCAPYLNGYGIGARYDGTYPESSYVGDCSIWNNIAQWTPQMRSDMQQYLEAQLDTFEANANGWIFWNFKTEGPAPEWSAFTLLDAGLFPQPLTQRQFPSACDSSS
ncbi:MAG: exo-1,3-beta-glucanase [Claussenomyces sp. TS43310]|nr:MAG: exo-1,3-beta-glucanase [Claussenomyces sp. TS43310]